MQYYPNSLKRGISAGRPDLTGFVNLSGLIRSKFLFGKQRSALAN